MVVCPNCLTNHPNEECPGNEERCISCGQIGHFPWTCSSNNNKIKLEASSKVCPMCGKRSVKHASHLIYYCTYCCDYLEVNSDDEDSSDSESENKQSIRHRFCRNPCKNDKPSCSIS